MRFEHIRPMHLGWTAVVCLRALWTTLLHHSGSSHRHGECTKNATRAEPAVTYTPHLNRTWNKSRRNA
jgi:hypothetical protein